MGCNLVGSQPRFQSSVMHTGRERRSGRHSTYVSPRKLRIHSSGGSVIGHCEWIERILNRHANAIEAAAYPEWVSCIREYVRRKKGWHLSAVPERAHVLEVGKHLIILLAKFVVERADEVFSVQWC